MNADEFELFDALYVLRSLSAEDRRAFESHLETCTACTARVARLRDVPALLSLAPESAFDPSMPELSDAEHQIATWAASSETDDLPTWSAEPMPEALLARLLRETRRERNRRRFVGIASMAAAAACVVALITVVVSHRSGDPYQAPPGAMTMATVAGVPIEAEVEITTHDTWAQVNIWCTYRAQHVITGDYRAVARTKAGTVVPIGSWPAVPGQTAIIRTPTLLHPNEIASIEIVSASGVTLSHLDV